jgi:hypothetical protein
VKNGVRNRLLVVWAGGEEAFDLLLLEEIVQGATWVVGAA